VAHHGLVGRIHEADFVPLIHQAVEPHFCDIPRKMAELKLAYE
jgi:hypothetical protein